MFENFRNFEVIDLFGRTWKANFLWQQNGISIRHADTVDVKFELLSGDTRETKAVALAHPDLLALSRKAGRPVTDAWCSLLAALHLKQTIETGEDLDKQLLAPSLAMLERHQQELERHAAVR